ncbi:MAG TPA: Crp/Fnr family transcriptional regulator [Stellaceae bacterium]|nr:Crp/Fnr family transcriptional regulator [Stellaceae bacterium]
MASDRNDWLRPGRGEETLPPPAGNASATADFARRPRFAAAASEDLLSGARRLHAAFFTAPARIAERGARLLRSAASEPPIVRLHSGFAYRACVLADGRRAILDILVPNDIIGLDHITMSAAAHEFVAAARVSYRALPADEVRRLMADPAIALHLTALLAESRWRAYRLAVSLGRLDAQARICLMLLDLYDRLRRRELIVRPTFNLPLTQEQIADHLGLTVVHVNRTLRRLREQKLVIVDRQVVIILDLDGLRGQVNGLTAAPEEIAEEAAEPALSPERLPLGR